MKTRKEYLDKKCTHAEFYGQFVNESVKRYVLSGIGKDAILNSNDENFNDIPLSMWDAIGPRLLLPISFKSIGDITTLSGLVCIAKEAARQIKEEAQV